MEQILAVYDTDIDYGDRLTAYLNTRTSHPFQMVAFTSRQALMNYLERHYVDVLLISQSALTEEIRSREIGQIMLLTEGKVLEELNQYPSIYKYQSSDCVIHDVVQAYQVPERKNGGEICSTERIGIYSPLGRCMKTSLTLVLGELLSKEKETVCCSLEAFSGLGALLEKNGPEDLSDALFYFRQGLLHEKIQGLIHTSRQLDYLAPPRCPEDLHSVSTAELNQVLRILEQSRPYRYCVVDVGSYVTDVAGILGQCSRILMPVKEDSLSLAKLQEYETYMRQAGQEEILLRTEKWKLPYSHCFGGGEVYLEQLIWGEFGDYVRSKI